MKMVLICTVLLLSFSVFVLGQTKTLTGKIIDTEFNFIGGVQIESSDKILLTTTEFQTGEFNIQISDSIKSLLIRAVGYESKPIIFDNNCVQLEIILERNVTYDFMTLEEADRLRLEQFNKLPKLYRKAYDKGFFKKKEPCYKQKFMPYSELKRFQNIIL